MKKNLFAMIVCYLCLFFIFPVSARTIKTITPEVQTLDNQILINVYALKKTRHYTAVEIGFTNPTDKYLKFTPQEIYLDDAVKYSLKLLDIEQVRMIEQKKTGLALWPAALGVGLGIASIATSRSSNNASFGLAMGALSMGGAALLTKGFENQAKQNKLIGFIHNSIDDIERLPPGMTLGGLLYFPATKKPKSITVISKKRSGSYEKKVFEITKSKKKRR